MDRAGRAGRFEVRHSMVGFEDVDPAAKPGRRMLRPFRVADGDDARAKPACNPLDHRSAPAGVSPKLCSMKEKSVSTSPRKLAANSGQFRNDGELIRTVRTRPAATSTQ